MTLLWKRGEPWFDDGNIILVTTEDPTAFRVHRGVLGRHSEIFQGMFAMPQPSLELEVETFEGCQVIRMYDLPSELSDLVIALYDGAEFHNRNFEDFLYLAGILRLSTKYFIGRLRTQAIQFLAETWAFTLEGHDVMVKTALTLPFTDITYPYVHPLHVLNLAKEVNVRIVVPSTIYFLSLYPLAGLLQGDHPKLVSKHPSTPSSLLRPEDIKDYTLMFQHRLTIILDFVRQFVDDRRTTTDCPTANLCVRGFTRLSSRLSRSWVPRTGPLHFMLQAIQAIHDDLTICEPCRMAFENDVNALRKKLWDDLPSVIGFPDWGQLETIDLPV